MDDKEKVLIIINPVSGTGKQKTALKAIKNNIDRINFDYEIARTKHAGHATEIARQAAADGYDIVVAVGGDGTVNEVAAGLVDTQTKMGIIPCGSGNGLARSLKIPVTPTKAVEVLNENRMKRIDTMSVNGNFCASIAGIGFDALIAKEFQEKPKNTRGLHSYVQLIATKYPTYKANEYKIEIDGKSSVHKAMFICLANANQFGYNAIVSPNSRIDDGLIDVCIVKNIPLITAPHTAMLLLTNNLDHSHRVKILQGKTVKICNNTNEYANIDGEAKQVGKTVEISIKHKSLIVIC
ncbi:MAG: diacylglycerol kinase family lipid kinase [Bacteroidales bacterium]|nr:diacylglycerol kinase family lipid kinase [Bacteroidales bacterium]